MSTIAIPDDTHVKILDKQMELLKGGNKVRLVDLNDYLIQKGLDKFEINDFLERLK